MSLPLARALLMVPGRGRRGVPCVLGGYGAVWGGWGSLEDGGGGIASAEDCGAVRGVWKAYSPGGCNFMAIASAVSLFRSSSSHSVASPLLA